MATFLQMERLRTIQIKLNKIINLFELKLLSIIALVVLGASCTASNKMCTYHAKYLRKDIDTTKEYRLKGVYCIAGARDTALGEGDSGVVKVNVFDRVHGRQVEDGVIYFYGRDTISMIFNNTAHQKKIKAGDYVIEAWSGGYTGTKTRKLVISKDKQIEINFYLGTTVEF